VKLNWLGRAAMNNAARAGLQRRYVVPTLRRLGGAFVPNLALEVGCGGGAGINLVREGFGARRVLAFDLDPRMIARARRRLAVRPGGRALLALGDATEIPAGDGSFDAVFDFGAIHLVPEWEKALDEVRRVLRPGGAYFFEWVTGRALRAFYPAVTEGFRGMTVPDAAGLLDALERRGIVVGRNFVRPRPLAATNLVGDVIGVGRVAIS
jgi:ubiquinone/menaquinone biosynthesis C-methylase UbiE